MPAYLIPNLLLLTVNTALGAFLVYYLRSLKRKGKALSRFENNAEQKVEKIIEQAREKGQQILMEADYVTTDQEKLLEDTLVKIRKDNLKAIEKELSSQEDILTKQYLSKMEETWLQLNKRLEEKTQQILRQYEEDTRKYKEERIAQLEKEISNQVLQISAKVLNKAIPLDQQNDQVIAALEQAKKEGLFNF